MWILLSIWACGPSSNLHEDTAPHPSVSVSSSSSVTSSRPSSTSPSKGCHWTHPPTLTEPASERVHLVAILEATSSEPGGLTLSLDGSIVGQWPATTDHRVPVLQLRPDTEHIIEATIDCAGTLLSTGPMTYETPALDIPFPDVTLVASTPEHMTPGVTLIDLGSPDTEHYIVVLEADGTPVWIWEADEKIVDARLMPDGHIWAIEGAEIIRLTRTGELLARYTPLPDKPKDLTVEGYPFHHEVFPTEDGRLFSLSRDSQLIEDYPAGYLPSAGVGDETVEAPLVVELDPATGNRLDTWNLLDMLDPTRIGFQSLDDNPAGLDWGHLNGMEYHPPSDSFLASLRHQDAVVRFRSDGSVRWILANHEGWGDTWQPYLLEPSGESFGWPYHQHGPMLHPDDDGRVLMFDNGNYGRVTPYSTTDGVGNYSRLVEYQVSELDRTIQQTWEYRETLTGELYSSAFGDADYLDGDNILGVFGFLYQEGGVDNNDLGLGDKSARVIEIARDRDNQVVWDVRFNGVADIAPGGWQVHRAQRLESLYVVEGLH